MKKMSFGLISSILYMIIICRESNQKGNMNPHNRMRVMAALGVLWFSGCGGSSPQPKVVRVAYVPGPSELLHAAALRFAEQVKTESGGKMEVRLYPGGQLGNERERRFTPEEREILLRTLDATTCWHNREVEQAEAEYRRKLEVEGAEFVAVDTEPFRQLARERIPLQFENVWKPGLYREISASR